MKNVAYKEREREVRLSQFIWSSFQQAFFSALMYGRKNLMLDAVAGSGKTSTIVEGARRVKAHFSGASVLFCAFNRKIVGVLAEKMPGVDCKTMNSLGFGLVSAALSPAARKNMFSNKNQYKYKDLLRTLLQEGYAGAFIGNGFNDTLDNLSNLLSFAMSSLSDLGDESLRAICDHYDLLDFGPLTEEDAYSVIKTALIQGEAAARQGFVSFDDQIYLPFRWNLMPKFRYDFVFVDEAQDTSPAKLDLILRFMRPEGRIVFVGDPRQAIYGFAGADARAWENISLHTGAESMPLSVSYRCPKAVIAEAQHIVPHIQAAENASEGVVRYIKASALEEVLQPADLILCRKNAPLLRKATELLKHKIPARMEGRDLEKGLVRLASDALGQGSWDDIFDLLAQHEATKIEVLSRKKHSEAALVALTDRYEGVRALIEGFASRSLAEFKTAVKDLFADSTRVVNLSSIHRAKGLEAKNIFILEPENLPLQWKGQQPWEEEQEINLKYVAQTRALESLNYVRKD